MNGDGREEAIELVCPFPTAPKLPVGVIALVSELVETLICEEGARLGG